MKLAHCVSLNLTLKVRTFADSKIQNNTAQAKCPKNNHMTSTSLFLECANL